MSNFKGSIDLLKLKGAELRSIDINGTVRNVVVVPVDWNDIYVPIDNTTAAPSGAYLNLRAWETNEKYRQAAMESNSGKENFVAPSHHLVVNYGEDSTKKAIDSITERLKKDPTYMSTNPSAEDIAKKAKFTLSNAAQLGKLTPLQPKQQQTYTSAAPIANTGAYTPPAMDASIPDDLPF